MNIRTVTPVVLVLFLGLAATAVAQTTATQTTPPRTTSTRTRPPVELGAFYGYAWTWSQEAYYGALSGDLDIADSGAWGVHLDYPVRPGMWAQLLYASQSSDLTFKDRVDGETTLTGLSINYWQLGAVQALKEGKVVPFTSLSLGGTYVTEDTFDESKWYFSAILGLGAKIYTSEKMGLRVTAQLPVSFTGGGMGFGVGTGGASAGFYGTGVTQTILSGGAFVRF